MRARAPLVGLFRQSARAGKDFSPGVSKNFAKTLKLGKRNPVVRGLKTGTQK
jgi:hypothetical protein